MRGADGVRDRIVELLRFEVARKVPLLRTAFGLDAEKLPLLDEVVSGEATDRVLDSKGDTWVTVINPRLNSMTRVDIRNGLPVYMNRYSCRIYVWAKSLDWKTAIDARDNLALACRLSLLEYPNLTPDTRGDTGYRLHENTYTEEFGEPLRLASAKGGRVWAGAVLAIDADCEETLEAGSTRPPIGINNEVITDAFAVGPTQPLPGE